MDLEKQLQDIGFDAALSKAYLALLEMEDSTVSSVAEKTKINRSLLYSILQRLLDKGLASYILKNGIRYYRAAEPTKILAELQEKQKTMKSLMPTLLAMHSPKTKRPVSEILEGRDGLKTVLSDLLRQRKEWFAFNIPGKGPEIMGPMIHAFEKDRQKAKIKLNVICIKTKDGLKRGYEFSKMKHTKVRYMQDIYESPASNWIYGDRVVVIFWYKEFPFALRIIDKNLAESYKHHFESLWNHALK